MTGETFAVELALQGLRILDLLWVGYMGCVCEKKNTFLEPEDGIHGTKLVLHQYFRFHMLKLSLPMCLPVFEDSILKDVIRNKLGRNSSNPI